MLLDDCSLLDYFLKLTLSKHDLADQGGVDGIQLLDGSKLHS